MNAEIKVTNDGSTTVSSTSVPNMGLNIEYHNDLHSMTGGDKAVRYNSGKLDWTLIDFKSIEPLVEAMTYGATKYERENWKKPCDNPNQHIQSAFRHLIALTSGELIDKESGVHHSGHIMANMMMYLYQTNK